MAVSTCNKCGQPINFGYKILPATDQFPTPKKVTMPMNEDGTAHDCEGKYSTQQSNSIKLDEFVAPAPPVSLNIEARVSALEASVSTASALTSGFGALGKTFSETRTQMQSDYASLLTEFTKLKQDWQKELHSVAPIVVNLPGKEPQTYTEKMHKQTMDAVRMMRAVQGGAIMYLVGEPGSMKTSFLPVAAKMLGDLPWYVISLNNLTSRGELMGFDTANGDYKESPVYKVVKSGGILLLDEVDAGNANGLTALNVAATNKFVGFPNGETVMKHEDCYIIAAGNTIGNGASPEFIGRNQQDMATRTRFAFFNWETDWEFVAHITQDVEWTKTVKLYHDIVEKHGIKFVVSSRVAINGVRMRKAGFTDEEVLQSMVWVNLSVDECETVKADFKRLAPQVGLNVPTAIKVSKEFSPADVQLLAKAYNTMGKKMLVQQIVVLKPGWGEKQCAMVAEQLANTKVIWDEAEKTYSFKEED